MMRSLWTAATGMAAQQMNIDVTSNNLANVSTDGFKKSRAQFEDLMYQTLKVAGTENLTGDSIPTGLQVGMGVNPLSVHKIFTQGDFKSTNNTWDLAIEGEGFFRVMVNGEERYTRNGAFHPNSDNEIVHVSGNPLDPSIQEPPNTVTREILPDGSITFYDANHDVIGTDNIEIFHFQNPAGLKSMGSNMYTETDASGIAEQGIPDNGVFGSIGSSKLETSNVEIVDEMVNMIIGQRAYEINSKAIQTSDQMLQMANQMKR